ncbi:MAG TPA: OB-fold nucleic acid binding domain-containing protein [Actinomycetes bacterium]|nr:OB-fold nucleic acid binding domain-containing protein [Actinomycetes bacterium]
MSEQTTGRLRRVLSRWVSSTQELEAEELHEDSLERGCTAVEALVPRGRVRVSGTLRSVTLRPRAGVPALVADLYDGTGILTVVWLGRRRIPGIVPGRMLVASGRVLVEDGAPTIYNPRYQLLPGVPE